MEQPDRIHLRDYIVSADIGAFQTERGHDQRLRFNLTVELANQVRGVNDEVDRILSYDILTGAIAAGLADQRYNLLETLAEKIAAQVLDHPRAAQIEVTVEKIDRVPGALGVTLLRRAARVEAVPTGTAPRVLFYGRDADLPAGPVILVPDAPGLPVPLGGNERRIALLALDQAAWALAGRLGLHVADSQTEIDWAAGEGHRVVWAPSRMIADEVEISAEPEALAFWLAQRLNAPRLDWALPAGRGLPVSPAGFAISSAALA
ncbi:dihydroneopterin aldolase [Paracoccus aminophilus]|uniref:Dihydroneopterin aldolase n=1 Tax=Paracoccus aminophilus JCM 7686 TaxID=1367847 RepID=S5YDX3_PARAH|nr:dihydroneopterin aldolase [Paracoccus aminophilus]AGT09668.1 dihydroneopterin aldolase [Paracoccus aminophilus JCM 7686]